MPRSRLQAVALALLSFIAMELWVLALLVAAASDHTPPLPQSPLQVSDLSANVDAHGAAEFDYSGIHYVIHGWDELEE